MGLEEEKNERVGRGRSQLLARGVAGYPFVTSHRAKGNRALIIKIITFIGII